MLSTLKIVCFNHASLCLRYECHCTQLSGVTQASGVHTSPRIELSPFPSNPCLISLKPGKSVFYLHFPLLFMTGVNTIDEINEGLCFIAWICFGHSTRRPGGPFALCAKRTNDSGGFEAQPYTSAFANLLFLCVCAWPIKCLCPPRPPTTHQYRQHSWHPWTTTWSVQGPTTGSRWAAASTCLTFRPPPGGRSCCGRASRGRRRTPRPCPSACSVCSWGRTSDWRGPSPPTPPSSERPPPQEEQHAFFFFCSFVC